VSHDLTLFRKLEFRNLEYTDWDRHVYVDGGFMLVKRHILDRTRLNPSLNWGEMEDVDLSERLYQDGSSICFYKNAILLTQTHRLKPLRRNNSLLRKLLGPVIGKSIRFLRNKRIERNFHNFLKKDIL
jgi:GT2 family glycosyltransferase